MSLFVAYIVDDVVEIVGLVKRGIPKVQWLPYFVIINIDVETLTLTLLQYRVPSRASKEHLNSIYINPGYRHTIGLSIEILARALITLRSK